MACTRPNLLLFMPETLRADAVLGPPDRRARTPNMDRFGAQSATFTQAFAQMSYCTPSRCSMFTGLYPHSNGHRSIWHLLQRHERNLFQDLCDAGYRTVVFGKNDLIDHSWVDTCFAEYTLRVPPRGGGRSSPLPENSPLAGAMYRGRIDGTPHDRDAACVDSAIDFLDEDHDQPWCLFLPLSLAHPAYAIEEPYFSMHDRDAVPRPIPMERSRTRIYQRLFHDLYGGSRLDEAALREIKATYFGMVSRSDADFGRVLDKLGERGLEESTVVVLFSDHGDYAGDYGLVEKFCVAFEDCMLHVPLMIRAPDVRPGEHTALCEMTDLYPTLLDLLGLESRHAHFGRSLVPLMTGQTATHRDAVFAEGGRLPHEDQFTIRGLNPDSFYGRRIAANRQHPGVLDRALMVMTEQIKYVYCPRDGDELYDRTADPDDRHNLATDPDMQATIADLRGRLLQWMLETSDTLPLEQGKRAWT